MAPVLAVHEAVTQISHRLLARDVRQSLTPNETQKVTLSVAAVYVLAIALLWHIPFLSWIIYPFKLLTVGFHEMSHAIAGVLTCAKIESITLDPDEGGTTRMRGGLPSLTLPAGYLGSSLIGAALVVCGFDTNASKVACIVLAFFFLLTLWWARRSWVPWLTTFFTVALLAVFWIVAHSVVLRFFVLFLGVMSCFYSIWDIIDDTLARKLNTSDASEFAALCGCCPPRVWGFIWLLNSFAFFAAAVLIGIVVFKDDFATQREKSEQFLGGTPW